MLGGNSTTALYLHGPEIRNNKLTSQELGGNSTTALYLHGPEIRNNKLTSQELGGNSYIFHC
jgi:hypothetical protein